MGCGDENKCVVDEGEGQCIAKAAGLEERCDAHDSKGACEGDADGNSCKWVPSENGDCIGKTSSDDETCSGKMKKKCEDPCVWVEDPGETGDDCDTDGDCQDGAFCGTDDKCKEKKDSGEKCNDSGECKDTLFCGDDGTCEEKKDSGGECSDHEECGDGLMCGSDGKCIIDDRKPEDGECTEDDDCQEGLACGDEDKCVVDEEAGQCIAKAPGLEDRCDDFNTEGSCEAEADGKGCEWVPHSGGTCVGESADKDETCSANGAKEDCEDPCVWVPSQGGRGDACLGDENCEADLYCDLHHTSSGGKCKRKKEENDDCLRSNHCQDGFYCPEDTAVCTKDDRLDIGEDCETDTDCRDGLHCPISHKCEVDDDAGDCLARVDGLETRCEALGERKDCESEAEGGCKWDANDLRDEWETCGTDFESEEFYGECKVGLVCACGPICMETETKMECMHIVCYGTDPKWDERCSHHFDEESCVGEGQTADADGVCVWDPTRNRECDEYCTVKEHNDNLDDFNCQMCINGYDNKKDFCERLPEAEGCAQGKCLGQSESDDATCAGNHSEDDCTDPCSWSENLSKEGEECDSNSDCESGLFCNDSGKCKEKKDSGEKCDDSGACKDTLFCGDAGTCEETKDNGDEC